MTTMTDIRVKELEIELEEIRIKRHKIMHDYRMEELAVRKEIAKLYRPKKKKKEKK